MAGHPDILEDRDPVGRALGTSFGLHVALAASVVAYTWWQSSNKPERWGDPKSLGGGAYAVTPVNKIPLPSREGRINPVANDTESQIPSKPEKPQPKKTVVPPKDAIALKTPDAKKPQVQPRKETPQQYSSLKNPPDNQINSRTGQATTSPMFSAAPGGGGVGSGSASPFGLRFGWYEQLLREKVARNWRSQDLDANNRNAVVVTFVIQRDGRATDVRVTRPSGNFAIDQSAQRAILMSSPFPPLPPQFERESATIEFFFRLQ